jgi:hypothetical protein
MLTTQPFFTTASESGTITLPEELHGKRLKIVVENETPKKNTEIPSDNDFWHKKSLDEIDAEQGGPKICTNPDDYFGFLSDIWESKEEVEQFLRRRKNEP